MATRQIVDAFEDCIASILLEYSIPHVRGLEIAFSASGKGREPCKFETFDRRRKTTQTTTITGNPDYTFFTCRNSQDPRTQSHTSRELEPNLDWWRAPFFTVKTLDKGLLAALNDREPIVTVLETKCPSFGESNSDDALLKHLPQVIAQSRVGFKRLQSYDPEGTVPFILTDSNTWFFGALATTSDGTDKWTCFRSQPIRLSLDDAGSAPDTPASIKFDQEVTFLLKALLCWICIEPHVIRHNMQQAEHES